MPYVSAEAVEWPAVRPDDGDVFLMGCVAVGTLLALNLSSRSASALLVVLGALILVAAVQAARHFARRRRVFRARLEAARTGRPVWEADWQGPREALESPWRLGPRLRPLVAFPALFAGVAAGNLLHEGAYFAAILVGGPAVLFVIVLALRKALRGRLQVRLDAFPLRTGSTVVLHVATTPGGARLRDVQVLLRCAKGVRIGRRIWYTTKWSRVVALRPDRWPGPDEFVGVAFDVPADAPATSLHVAEPVRWELVVAANTSWGRFLETVLVPVYAPDDAATANG